MVRYCSGVSPARALVDVRTTRRRAWRAGASAPRGERRLDGDRDRQRDRRTAAVGGDQRDEGSRRHRANTTADAFGRFTIHNLAPGSYTVSVHFIGYAPMLTGARRSDDGDGDDADELRHVADRTEPGHVPRDRISADRNRYADRQSGLQAGRLPRRADDHDVADPPGVDRRRGARAHGRGPHSRPARRVHVLRRRRSCAAGHLRILNELFDPDVVNSINFQTGGWDAEYGGRNAAIVNVTTKIPAGGFHGSLSSNGGSYDPTSTLGARGYNGQIGERE